MNRIKCVNLNRDVTGRDDFVLIDKMAQNAILKEFN
jgi:hypothetical protein